jgi:hypothetical protein
MAGRRRPTSRFRAAGDVMDFALVAVYGLKVEYVCPRQGRLWPTPRYCAAGTGGVTTVQNYVHGGAPAAKLSADDLSLSKAKPPRCTALLLLRQRSGAASLGKLQ